MIKIKNLWRAFIRKLPKRIIVENKMYHPQVWFIWWHYVWEGVCEYASPMYFRELEHAISFIEHNWEPIEKPKIKIVWRS